MSLSTLEVSATSLIDPTCLIDSTSPDLNDPRIQAQLDIPTDGQPHYALPFAQYLHDLDTSKMQRLASRIGNCSRYYRKYRDASGHMWTRNISCCKQGSCIQCSLYRATVEFDKYRVLESVIGESFCYIVTSLPFAQRIRKVLNKLKSPLLSKVGWLDGRMASRMLLCTSVLSISGKMTEHLRNIDPFISITALDKSVFLPALNKLLRPEIPPEHEDRLKYELINRRLTFQGMNQGDRKKLFVNTNIQSNNSSATSPNEQDSPQDTASDRPDDLPAPKKNIPKCPECHKPAIEQTQTHTLGTPDSELTWKTTG